MSDDYTQIEPGDEFMWRLISPGLELLWSN